MVAFRLYRLFRRAGNSPCTAYRLTQAAQPGVLESAMAYVSAAVLAVASVAVLVVG
ncbi:hypothetical protein QRO11_12140 [Paracidovorax citrulli]|uniref:hypothetical protein n=1 Tax=Paracidovorax citrulli TaxID=80869 RepID=UPI0008885AF1|nr:hypothetical protein [Paracidovorax citrulli]WIY32734.1 hypothetical protein QRO11_12140 [Paracidovorax citrulli]SDJ31957.1 hypothetical protein SAMN04489709_10393 [Paracidovorax citrulli]